MSKRYRVGELAALGGVSVRTLHHYERIGLLSPTSRTEAGHRIYSDWDLLYLQQVLTLRYLGFSLAQIRDLMHQPLFDLETSLRAKSEVLGERMGRLRQRESALQRLLVSKERSGEWDWSLVASASTAASKALNKENRMNDQEMMQRFAEFGSQLEPGQREDIERQWAWLINEVQDHLDLEPTGSEARGLADRWLVLSAKTGAIYTEKGFGDLWLAVGAKYRDYGYADNPNAPSLEVGAFIVRVNELRD